MTELEQLSTSESGHIAKSDAVRWMEGLEKASDEALKDTVIPKPADFSGSKYPTEISTIRITGAPAFIEAAASRLKPLLDFEDDRRRIEINLQQTEDRETGDLTDNYALYLSVAERG